LTNDYETSSELLYGRVGYLYAANFVNRYFGRQIVSDHILKQVVAQIIRDGRHNAHNRDMPLMWQWHDSEYIGAVHGVSGIIYILLDFDFVLNDQKLMEDISDTCKWMSTLVTKSNNFPSRGNSLYIGIITIRGFI
jgi:lantibiotic modifying enzyme